MKGLDALQRINENVTVVTYENFDSDIAIIKKELKALEFIRENIIIKEQNGYIEFYCDFTLPTNSKYEKEEKYKEKIDLLKEVLL